MSVLRARPQSPLAASAVAEVSAVDEKSPADGGRQDAKASSMPLPAYPRSSRAHSTLAGWAAQPAWSARSGKDSKSHSHGGDSLPDSSSRSVVMRTTLSGRGAAATKVR